MPLQREIFQEINELVAIGKTEQALVKLRRSLETDAPTERKALQHTLLLSGQYHTWEDEKINGIKEGHKELARINKELLRLVDNLANPDDQAHSYTPPVTTSPDPLKPIYIQVQTPSNPAPPAKQENNTMKYVSYFFIAMGVLFVIGLLATIGEEEEKEKPSTQGQEVIVSEPENSTPVAPTPADEFEPKVSQVLSGQILNKLISLTNSDAELDPSDLQPLNTVEVRQQLAGSLWHHPSLNFVQFSNDGQTASYLNGGGVLQLAYSTKYGFYIGQYSETTTNDNGLMSIVPPNNNDILNIYVESNGFGTSGMLELKRR